MFPTQPIWSDFYEDEIYPDGNGGYICPWCFGIIGSIGCCSTKERDELEKNKNERPNPTQ